MAEGDPTRTAADARHRGRFAESMSAVREVVVHPQLRRAQLAFGLACAGDAAFTVGLAVVAYRDGGPRAVGLLALARMLPSALAAPLLCAVADRIRRERVMVMVTVFRAFVIGAAAVLLEVGAPTPIVYTFAVVATVAFTVFRPAHSALLPSLCTTTRELTSANVVRGVVDSSAALIGPALAGVLLVVSDPTAVFAAVAALSLAAAVVTSRIRYEAVTRSTSVPSAALGRDTVEGLRVVARHRDLVLVFGLAFAQTVVRGGLNVFIVVVALELLETGDGGVAALSAAVGAGGVIGALGVSLLVGSRHLGVWLAVALVLWGAPIALIGVAPTETAAFVLLAVVGLGNAIIDVPIFTLPVRLADDALLARVFGVLESLAAFGVGLGSVLAPVLISLMGLRGALIAIGLILPLLAALCLRRLTALDGRLVVRDDEIAVLRNAPMLGQLPVPSIEHLASKLRRRTVSAGALLFEQGDPGDAFYVIASGEAEVLGDGAVVRTLRPGESFGEIALVRDVPRTATVRALTALDVFEVDREQFLDTIGGYTPSGDAASAVVARHLANFSPVGIGP